MSAAPEGHNGQLLAFVERIERMHEERKAIADDISEIYTDMKSTGFDAKIIKKIVADRAKDPDKLREERELYELYAASIGFDP